MKKYLILFQLIFISLFSASQNLVPNASFESYGILPCSWILTPNDFTAAMQNWVLPTNGSSDVLSTLVPLTCWANCNSNAQSLGHQSPHTGNVMAGIATFGPGAVNSYREYLEVALINPLIIGQTYYAEFYVSRAENVDYGCNNLGMYFSDAIISDPTYGTLNLIPQVNETNIIPDTIEWVRVSGTFTATSAAHYLIIGNFYDDGSTLTSTLNTNTFPNAYYFIDDVSVSIATGINGLNGNSTASIYPNPVTDCLIIHTNSNQTSSVILYDAASRKVLETVFTNTIILNTKFLLNGIYFYEVRNYNGIVKKGKVVKQ